MKFGTTDIQDLKLGSTPIVEVRRGTELIWPEAASEIDVTSITYDNVLLDAVALGIPSGNFGDMTFNRDFTKAYLLQESTSDKAHQIDLSTAGDLSTASFNNKSLTLQGTDRRGIYISNDQTKIYAGRAYVEQYDLSTPGDLSTGSYSGKRLQVNQPSGFASSFCFSEDEQTIVVLDGNIDDNINQYDLTTAGDPSTGSYSGNTLNISAQESVGAGIAMTRDGKTIFTVGQSNKLHEFTSTSPNDISGFSYSGQEFANGFNGKGITINETDQKIYILDNNGNIRQYSYQLK